MHPPATAPATAQQASRGARSGSATASGANTAPLGPGTAELCSTSHVAVAVPAQPDSAQRCKAAMTRESIALSNDAGAHRNGGQLRASRPFARGPVRHTLGDGASAARLSSLAYRGGFVDGIHPGPSLDVWFPRRPRYR